MSAATASTDRITDEVLLPKQRTRVWRALTDPAEFGAWFGVNLAGVTFAPGAQIRAPMTIPGHTHVFFDVRIEEIRPQDLFSWRWHPNAMDTNVDWAKEQRTLVTITLEDAPGGTLLRVVETGFDALFGDRRTTAFTGNTNGWRSQLHKRLMAYLEKA